uniref:Mitochondrial uncoupling protein 4 n=1 Tax=Plectus sambesii TaxID=2011161 RepID=A0A914V1L4_9BILA
MLPDASQRNSFIFKYILSSTAATVAEVVTYPLDLTKTRLQVQGERSAVASTSSGPPAPRHGMFRIAVGIARDEGVLRLWQGVTPAIYRHFVYTGVRMAAYEHLRENVFHRNEDGTFAFWKSIVCGAVAGFTGQFLASPADLVKIQMQMEGHRRLQGLPPRVHNMWHAFRTVIDHNGVRGLWKGWMPNCQRAALVNMADLATYDKLKHWLLAHTALKDDVITHSISSAGAGFAAAIVSTPADVVKTRIMNQPYDKSGRGTLYHGSIDCLMQTVRAEGFLALYKGFVPIYIRMAPWSLTFWVSYEKIRYLTGASSF